MEIRLVSVDAGLLYFRCRGALGYSSTGDSSELLRRLVSEQSFKGNVLLDLRDVDSVGTESIAWLVHWHRRVTKAGGVLGLCCVPRQFMDFFRLCQVHRLMPVWDDETAGRTALAGSRPGQVAPPAPGPGGAPDAEADLGPEDRVIPLPVPPPGLTTGPAGPPEVEGRLAGKGVRGVPGSLHAASALLARPEAAPPGSAAVEPTVGQGVAPAAQHGRDTPKGVEVLVVDDSAVERLRAGTALQGHSGPGSSSDGGIHVLYASNARAALDLIQQRRPALVVTDLVMPERDGLWLVKEIRSAYPSLPVVLMTAHGSEEIAAAALRAGAASYVPKKYLARDLRQTVETILRLAQADREQLIFPHLAVSEYQILLPNDLALVSPLVDFLQGHLGRVGLCREGEALRVAVALREALVNACTHGNLEAPGGLRETDYEGYLRCVAERQKQSPYKDRRVHVTARETPQEVVYTIRDEGPGFDTTSLPDPTDSENFKNASGRGLYLIRAFMDEVTFNEAGNEITLVKRRRE